MKPILLPLACLAFLVSCGSLQEPEYRGMENFRVGKFGFGESIMHLDIHYFNPNPSRLKLKKAEGEAWIGNRHLGHFIIDTMVHIPAKGDFRLPVKLSMDMKKILGNSLLTILSDSIRVKIEGRARVGKGFIFINYPFSYEGMHNLKELMK